jgi:hypothetical protein
MVKERGIGSHLYRTVTGNTGKLIDEQNSAGLKVR